MKTLLTESYKRLPKKSLFIILMLFCGSTVFGQSINGRWHTGSRFVTFQNGIYNMNDSWGNVLDAGNYSLQGNVIYISSRSGTRTSYYFGVYNGQMIFQNNQERMVFNYVSSVRSSKLQGTRYSKRGGEDKQAYRDCMNGDEQACMRWMKSLDNPIGNILDETDTPQLASLRRRCQNGDTDACKEEIRLRNIITRQYQKAIDLMKNDY